MKLNSAHPADPLISHRFVGGATFWIDGQRQKIIERVDRSPDGEAPESLVTFMSDTRTYMTVAEDVLLKEFVDGRVTFMGPAVHQKGEIGQIEERRLHGASAKAIGLARRRTEYVRAAIGDNNRLLTGERLTAALELTWSIRKKDNPSEKKPTVRSIYRWARKYEKSQSIVGLLANDDRKGNRTPRLQNSVVEIILDCIGLFYLDQQRISIKTLSTRINIRIRTHNQLNPESNLRQPSYRTVCRYVSIIPAFERDKARRGYYYAATTYGSGLFAPEPVSILDIVEIDHSPIDVILICSKTYKVNGRAHITLVIDKKSRAVLGFYITYNAPSNLGVLRAVEHAMLPKTYLKDQFPGVKGQWNCYGKFATAKCDNAPEFHSEVLASSFFSIGSMLYFCPKQVPKWKGSIESFIRTMMVTMAHEVPGTSKSNYAHLEDYDAEGNAILTIEDLNYLIHKWIVDIYMQAIHSSTDETPAARWNRLALEYPPHLPPSSSWVKERLMESKIYKLRKTGITRSKIRYDSIEAADLRKIIGNDKDVRVLFDDEDLNQIYVINPLDNSQILLHSHNPEYTSGLTLMAHRSIAAARRDSGAAEHDSDSWLASKSEFDEDVIQAANRSRQGRRKLNSERAAERRRKMKSQVKPDSAEPEHKRSVGGGRSEIAIPKFERARMDDL